MMYLDLDSGYIGDTGAIALAGALDSNTAITRLNLASNNIGANGATALAEMLETNTAVTYLQLYGNNIGASGATAIAEVLKVNTALTMLVLLRNNIGDDGAIALAEALKSNNTALTSLNVADVPWTDDNITRRTNNIGDRGVYALTMATKNKADFKLYLSISQTCNSHGTAQEDGTCTCTPPWSGDVCQTECNNHGTAQEDGTCTCTAETGWIGDVCETACNNHGTPEEDGTCTCTGGWSGDVCQTEPLNVNAVCDPENDFCNQAEELVCSTSEYECRYAPSNVGQTADSSAAPFSADIVSAVVVVVAVCC